MKKIFLYESEDGKRFESESDCANWEQELFEMRMKSLLDSISYEEFPLFDGWECGRKKKISPLMIYTAMPRNESEMRDLLRYVSLRVFGNMDMTTALPVSPAALVYPYRYTILSDSYRFRRKCPSLRLWDGKEFSRLANLISGHIPHSEIPLLPAIPTNVIEIEAAVEKPVKSRRYKQKISYNGAAHTIKEWSLISGLPYQTFRSRLDRGWSMQDAVNTPKGQARIAH